MVLGFSLRFRPGCVGGFLGVFLVVGVGDEEFALAKGLWNEGTGFLTEPKSNCVSPRVLGSAAGFWVVVGLVKAC